MGQERADSIRRLGETDEDRSIFRPGPFPFYLN